LKEPGLLGPALSSFIGGEEKSLYNCNCIMSSWNMLDACPTSNRRIHTVFYEPFLSILKEWFYRNAGVFVLYFSL
jgi:hypothetical protein